MRRFILMASSIGVLLSACNAPAEKAEKPLNDFSDSASYALGATIGLNFAADLEAQGVDSSFDRSMLMAGLSEAILSDSTRISKEDGQQIVTEFFDRLSAQRADRNLKVGETFLQENAGRPGVTTTASGLQYIVLKEGEGDSPTKADQVKVHYTGKLLNGDVFDSSFERNEPVTFYVRSVIPGWTEALQLMKPGAEYKLFVPGALAYGEQGGPRGSGIGPNEVLIFDVRLIDIITE